MISSGEDFCGQVMALFHGFLDEFGFYSFQKSVGGRYYKVDFIGQRNTVSVSYEPAEEYLLVAVLSEHSGGLSDFDDLHETPRLHELNAKYMSTITSEQRQENDQYFRGLIFGRDFDSRILKAAMELRLVLPLHLAAFAGR